MSSRTCSVEGCENRHHSRQLCQKHYRRVARTGTLADPQHPSHWLGERVGYKGAHDRVRQNRGSAREYECKICSSPARSWAYDHTDPDEKASPKGAYSTDVTRYIPLCDGCHTRLDSKRLELIHV